MQSAIDGLMDGELKLVLKEFWLSTDMWQLEIHRISMMHFFLYIYISIFSRIIMYGGFCKYTWNVHRTLRLKTTIYESDQVYHVGLEPTTLSKVETTMQSNFSQLFSVKSSSKTILYLPADLKKNIYQNWTPTQKQDVIVDRNKFIRWVRDTVYMGIWFSKAEVSVQFEHSQVEL